MDIAGRVDALRREGRLLADAAEGLDPAAPVPTCPGWVLRELLLHLGGVHRWAAAHVRERRTEPLLLARAEDIEPDPPGDAGLVAWFRAGHSALVAELSAARPELECWTFLPAPSPLDFWSRRQLHETAVHRADVYAAAAAPVEYPTGLALDGVEEILTGFAARRRSRLPGEAPRTLLLTALDAPVRWRVRVGPEGNAAVREDGAAPDEPPGPGGCAVRARAAELYLLLWNRRGAEGLDVRGDAGLLADWRASVRVRWS
ncbi:maleylpyruvate isomerase family mycothiol-dependent enzyme [Allonocardiopsis opalescens]|uniref:Uncharacterized protein (TIGR03083 family) n=1 Tax=Allonocardiopsis opalescens TaxID=1144618 RepID=A0A2T0Q5H0_9ACTN|nr:maleylpyruvate isomerase family mycothiol-dependent enzyme [Allonocardiopsis opalescens]PRX99067.1 uncharacterized protein (TIGR03083 family) [Allonocardiopsis opalescens]